MELIAKLYLRKLTEQVCWQGQALRQNKKQMRAELNNDW